MSVVYLLNPEVIVVGGGSQRQGTFSSIPCVKPCRIPSRPSVLTISTSSRPAMAILPASSGAPRWPPNSAEIGEKEDFPPDKNLLEPGLKKIIIKYNGGIEDHRDSSGLVFLLFRISAGSPGENHLPRLRSQSRCSGHRRGKLPQRNQWRRKRLLPHDSYRGRRFL